MTYSTSQSPSSSLQQSAPSAMSRLRASSSAFPPGLDLRAQYRSYSSQQSPNGLPTSARSSSFAGSYTGGYASAPLAAPVDFSLPRTPNDVNRDFKDFSIPQLSAPMAPPQDFSNAYRSTLSPRQQTGDRDFDSQNAEGGNQAHNHMGEQQQQHGRNSDTPSYLRPIEYEAGQKRKRSFTMPGTFGTTS